MVQGVGVPVIVKETGCGMAKKEAQDLLDVGVTLLDIGGAGGENQAGTGGGKIREYGAFDRAASALWNLSGGEAAQSDGVFAGGGGGGLKIKGKRSEDVLLAS